MFTNIQQKYKCSKCGIVDYYEIVIRDGNKYRRCRYCGHEICIEQARGILDNSNMSFTHNLKDDEPIVF